MESIVNTLFNFNIMTNVSNSNHDTIDDSTINTQNINQTESDRKILYRHFSLSVDVYLLNILNSKILSLIRLFTLLKLIRFVLNIERSYLMLLCLITFWIFDFVLNYDLENKSKPRVKRSFEDLINDKLSIDMLFEEKVKFYFNLFLLILFTNFSLIMYMYIQIAILSAVVNKFSIFYYLYYTFKNNQVLFPFLLFPFIILILSYFEFFLYFIVIVIVIKNLKTSYTMLKKLAFNHKFKFDSLSHKYSIVLTLLFHMQDIDVCFNNSNPFLLLSNFVKGEEKYTNKGSKLKCWKSRLIFNKSNNQFPLNFNKCNESDVQCETYSSQNSPIKSSAIQEECVFEDIEQVETNKYSTEAIVNDIIILNTNLGIWSDKNDDSKLFSIRKVTLIQIEANEDNFVKVKGYSKKKLKYKQSLDNSSNEKMEFYLIQDISLVAKTYQEMLDNKYKNYLMNKISHEVKTIIITSNTYIDRLLNHLQNYQQKNTKIESILARLQVVNEQLLFVIFEMNTLVNGLDNYKFEIEEINIDLIVSWSISVLKFGLETSYYSKSIVIDSSVNKINCFIECDIKSIKMILLHIIRNSLKFTRSGCIKISAEINQEDSNQIDIIVKDTGIGISKEKLHDILENFKLIDNKLNRKDSNNSTLSEYINNHKYNAVDENNCNKRRKTVSNFIFKNTNNKHINSEIMTSQIDNFSKRGGISMGLKLIKYICRKLKIRLDIKSKEGSGTTFTLSFKRREKGINRTHTEVIKKTSKTPGFYKDFNEKSKSSSSENEAFDSIKQESIKSDAIDHKNKFEMDNKIDSIPEEWEGQSLPNLSEVYSTVGKVKFLENIEELNNDFDNNLNIIVTLPKSQDSNNNDNFKLENSKGEDYFSALKQLKSFKEDTDTNNRGLLSNTHDINVDVSPILLKSNLSNKMIMAKRAKLGSTINFLNDSVKIDTLFISKSIKILIADDDYYCRKSLNNLLKQIIESNKPLLDNFEIIKVTDGIDLINVIVYDQSHENQVKLIITDENMMICNGSDALLLLNNMFTSDKLKKIPTWILTCLEDENELSRIKNKCKCDLIMKKPASRLKITEELLRIKIKNN